MSPKPKTKRTKAQQAASQAWAAAGRAAQAGNRAAYRKAHQGQNPPPTKAQHQAGLKWAAAGRASQLRKRQGKPPVTPKKRAAVMPDELLVPVRGPWLEGCNDVMPTCAAVAVANHLLAATGTVMPDDEILRLHRMAGGDDGATIENVLQVLHSYRQYFVGAKRYLAHFTRTDADVIVAGLVVGVKLTHAGHAVLSHPRGMVSWGQVLPWDGEPEEAWALEWIP